jgi:deoxyribonuclease V
MHPSQYEQLTPAQAIAIHEHMRHNVNIQPLDTPVRIIGGADVSCNKYEDTVYAGIVLLKYPTMEVVGHASAISSTRFPYIPGLLAFREVPSLLEVWEKLDIKPDVLVLDGQGIAHEQRMGIATHFGQLANVPTIGSAKKPLRGKFTEPANIAFAQSAIYDGDEKIGIALRSKKGSNPIYVSPGHRVSMEQSIQIIQTCIRGYRIPEPTRQAHNFVNQVRRAHGQSTQGQTSMF